MKLTKADRRILDACDDWKAPFEVDEILSIKFGTSLKRMNGLKRLGLLKYGRQNGTYRLTEAGRKILEDAK